MEPIKPIRSEADHRDALATMEQLWHARPGSPEHDQLEVLATLVDDWEANNVSFAPPDPVEAIRFWMGQNGHAQGDLAAVLGSPSRASEILHRRRALTLDMIRKLNAEWGLPVELLTPGYTLDRSAAE